ncbi:MAG: ectoine synthase [Alphaproteobacteria bacterium]|nr:ectoine synthase [Alphaproteobacteria bacterium]
MIVTDFEDLKNTDREVHDPKGQWTSLRKFLADQGLGYSFHRTTINPDETIHMEYKNHIELVSIIQGSGSITDKQTGQEHSLKPGITYLLDKHDAHILKAGPDGLQMHCIFTPAVTGKEVHGEDGAYPLLNQKAV